MLNKINIYLSRFGAVGAVIPASAVRGAEGYKCVIIAAFPYFNGISDGNISLYARGEDYHRVITKILYGLTEILPKDGKHTVSADISPIDERYTACIAGLGVMGKNGLFISEKLGSFVFLGSIITTSELECEPIVEVKYCQNCGKCAKACPGGAIGKDGVDYTRCISNVGQKKGELTEEEQNLLKKSGMVFGCDACQICCPYNTNLDITPIEAFKSKIINKLTPDDLSGLSNKTFKEKYERYAFSWRGVSVLRRNIGIIFGGSHGDGEPEHSKRG